jgi:hypothetical protein
MVFPNQLALMLHCSNWVRFAKSASSEVGQPLVAAARDTLS